MNLLRVWAGVLEFFPNITIWVDRGNDDVDTLVRNMGHKALKRLGPFDTIVFGEMLFVISIPKDFAKVITIQMDGRHPPRIKMNFEASS